MPSGAYVIGAFNTNEMGEATMATKMEEIIRVGLSFTYIDDVGLSCWVVTTNLDPRLPLVPCSLGVGLISLSSTMPNVLRHIIAICKTSPTSLHFLIGWNKWLREIQKPWIILQMRRFYVLCASINMQRVPASTQKDKNCGRGSPSRHSMSHVPFWHTYDKE